MELYWHPNAVCFLLALRNEEKIVSLQRLTQFFFTQIANQHGTTKDIPSVVCLLIGFNRKIGETFL